MKTISQTFEPLYTQLLSASLLVWIPFFPSLFTYPVVIIRPPVGVVDIIAFLWGVLRMVSVFILFVAPLFRLFFKPASWPEYREHKHIARVLARINRIPQPHKTVRSIAYLQGLVDAYPGNTTVLTLLGKQYLKLNARVAAGKHLFFTTVRSEAEAEAVRAFCRKLGNSPLLLLYATSRYIDLHSADTYTVRTIRALLAAITREDEQRSALYLYHKNALAQIDKPFVQRFATRYPLAAFEIGLAAVLLAMQILYWFL